MDDILKLAKDYSKKRHLDLLPRGNDNILEKIDYIYDENWEKCSAAAAPPSNS